MNHEITPATPRLLLLAKVELTDLPSHALIDGTSVRVKGSGYCTIIHVSYSDKPKETVRLELVRLSRGHTVEHE